MVVCQWFGLEGTLTVEHLSVTVSPSICHSAVAASHYAIYGGGISLEISSVKSSLCEVWTCWRLGSHWKWQEERVGCLPGEYWRMETYRSVGFAWRKTRSVPSRNGWRRSGAVKGRGRRTREMFRSSPEPLWEELKLYLLSLLIGFCLVGFWSWLLAWSSCIWSFIERHAVTEEWTFSCSELSVLGSRP